MQSGSSKVKCSGTRLLSAGLAQQHRKTRQAVNPKHCNSALVLVTEHLYEEWIFVGEMQWHKAAVSWFGTAAQKNKASS